MKINTKKVGLFALAITALSIAACSAGGKTDGSSSSSRRRGSNIMESNDEEEADPDDLLPEVVEEASYTIKTGSETPAATKVAYGAPIPKPTDPVAPAGKKFYGWMETNHGGRIWDFEDAHLNKVMETVVLEPLFVDASLDPQLIEAELSPKITEGTGMDGSTYSGGSKGKGLIYTDYENNFKTTTAKSFEYFEDEFQEKYDLFEEDDLKEEGFTYTKKNKTMGEGVGAFVHFMYNTGTGLEFEIECDKAVDNAVLFGRYSAEYGKSTPLPNGEDELRYTFKDTQFVIKVNGVALNYGEVTMHNIVDKTFFTFQDYLLGTSVSLKQGKNKIEMLVSNKRSLNGTIQASSPCIDSIKVLADTNITWPTAKYTNLL